jgi:hypothetical protein
MTIKTGDTVKLIAPFGLDEQGEAVYPDAKEIGKYGKVTGEEGDFFNVKLFDGGAEYGVIESELEKITFSIVDHKGKKVAGKFNSSEEANNKLSELMEGEGYWYVYGSDDNEEPWCSGGLSEYETHNQAA